MKADSYEMIIWWSVDDDAYVVDAQELLGCLAHGTTRQEAIKSWIETAKEGGQKIPQPRGRLVYA